MVTLTKISSQMDNLFPIFNITEMTLNTQNTVHTTYSPPGEYRTKKLQSSVLGVPECDCEEGLGTPGTKRGFFVQTWVIFFFRTLPPVPVLDDDMLVLSITMVDEDWSLELAASLLLSSKMSLMS